MGHAETAIHLTPIRLANLTAAGFVAFFLVGLISLFGATPGWQIGQTGHPRTNEYVGVRAADELALEGRAADAYDWALHRAQEAVIAGRLEIHYFQFPYPLTYFFVAGMLASMPFLLSALLWIATTLSLYIWSAIRISSVRVSGLWAAAAPTTLINTYVAHTGFLTAGLMGFGLEVLPKRPVLAGVLFGLLTLKLQLGLLIPIALVAGGFWRTILAACATATVLALISIAVLGIDTWTIFGSQLARISESARNGGTNLDLVVSIYGFLRTVGFHDGMATIFQLITSLLISVGIYRLWRSGAPHALKAAALGSASVLVSP